MIYPGAPELCNGRDDDCDGLIDENAEGTKQACGLSIGECKAGTTECINGRLICDGPTLVLPKEHELCNGKDDDCDGTCDEDFPQVAVGSGCSNRREAQTCEAGIGACKRSGHYVCDDAQTGVKCDVAAGAPSTEGPPGNATCYDGIDNDCNNLTDSADPKCRACTQDSECNDFNLCTQDSCTGGVCKNTPYADNTSCSDNLYCNGIEKCQSGVCVAGQKVFCDDNDPCTVDTCDETQKKCTFTLTPRPGLEGPPGNANCSDALDNDCDRLIDLADPDCRGCDNDLQCKGSDPCKNYYCNPPTKMCGETVKSEGAVCDDGTGTFCGGSKTCKSGICSQNVAIVCNDNNVCTTDTCSEALKQCIFTPISGCQVCTDNVICNDNNPCTQDLCISGRCQITQLPENSSCDDGQFCTVNKRCTSGMCVGVQRDCSTFGDVCNTTTCNEQTDTCQKIQKANGTVCDSSSFCNGTKTCLNGVCQGGTAVVCNDYNDCTVDTCNEYQRQCTFTLTPKPGQEGYNITGTCTDNIDNDCDGLKDYADPDCRQCQYDYNCTPTSSGQCVQTVCNLTTYRCETTNKANGSYCDDGQFCTMNDQCQNGVCTGSSRDCSSVITGDQCNYAFCDESTDSCRKIARSNGTYCEDGLFCTVNETCQNGYCSGGQQRNCSPGTCDEDNDRCTTVSTTSGCADGTREGFTDASTFSMIAGCGGGWTIAGLVSSTPASGCTVAGNTSSNPFGSGCNAANLCASGWHICANSSEVLSHLPNGKTCWDAWGGAGAERRFFASMQPSNGNGYCNTSGTNDIFGCGNYGDPPQVGSCGTLNVFSSEDCSAIRFIGTTVVWECGGAGDSSDERANVLKKVPEGGGVLCCNNQSGYYYSSNPYGYLY